MIVNFSIEYKTRWGEGLVLVIDGKKTDMAYGEGGIWAAKVEGLAPRRSHEYHYELHEGGKLRRREWKGHELKSCKSELNIRDAWQDVPQYAPFCTSGFTKAHLGGELTPEGMLESKWKCAGVAVPVFSLRSEDSFGIGDFHDLKKLVDWAAATGLKVIQLLPVNDTTATGTWTDSYPYSANSIYALHPQFIYLPELGLRRTKAYTETQAMLNAEKTVDYEAVNKAKEELSRKAFKSQREKVLGSEDYKKFCSDNAHWLDAYCAFKILRALNGQCDPHEWGKYAKFSKAAIGKLLAENREEADYQCFMQYHLDHQLREAADYAHEHGVMLKGDLPIGVSGTSVDAWQNPELFHLDCGAGAPPDAFATDGQTWGFPTYDWERMSQDGFDWWKKRFASMGKYFDAFRIDHILGFFRIWEIPAGCTKGLLGHFSPALPYSATELRDKGFDVNSLKVYHNGDPEDTNVLFVEDPRQKGYWHPRIAAQSTEAYRGLDDWHKGAFNALHDDFFYRRHDEFWRTCALSKLPELLAGTDMLACGEDLGMIPACVPEVMHELRILSLEIQRMPKSEGETFAHTEAYPYFSVCATSTHDMSPLRAWWKEDRALTQKYYNDVMHWWGEAPENCTSKVCKEIILKHLQSPSMMAILPLGDYLSLSPEKCFSRPEDERINVPAISPYYWRYRMKVTLESLAADETFTRELHELITSTSR